eukprot:c6373_g1_i1.p1 GENE.c6373_g1_i1~~c6373_g1_i1.p1  ORF type:complete len:239 (+),score=45.63 c6373_g1_i1:69-719(+)
MTETTAAGVKMIGDYELLKTLGSGTFAKVKLGRNVKTGKIVAVKIIEKQRIFEKNMNRHLQQEIATMKAINHPNVVHIDEVMASSSRIYIVMEYVPRGDLLDRIEECGHLPELKAMQLFRSMLAGVEACHHNGVIHRDLKPENILLTADDDIKVTDFGLSNFNPNTTEPALLDTVCGTPNYAAPEVLAGQGYDGALADVWSLGCILFVMVCGCLPF